MWFFLFQFIVMAATPAISVVVYGLLTLRTLLPSRLASARHLHEFGELACLLLVGLIPFTAWLAALYWFTQ